MELHLTGIDVEKYIKYRAEEAARDLKAEVKRLKEEIQTKAAYITDLEARLHTCKPSKMQENAQKAKDIEAASPRTTPFKAKVIKFPIEDQVVQLIRLAADSKLPPSQRTVAYMKAKSSKSESSIRKTVKLLGFVYVDGLITKAQ